MYILVYSINPIVTELLDFNFISITCVTGKLNQSVISSIAVICSICAIFKYNSLSVYAEYNGVPSSFLDIGFLLLLSNTNMSVFLIMEQSV